MHVSCSCRCPASARSSALSAVLSSRATFRSKLSLSAALLCLNLPGTMAKHARDYIYNWLAASNLDLAFRCNGSKTQPLPFTLKLRENQASARDLRVQIFQSAASNAAAEATGFLLLCLAAGMPKWNPSKHPDKEDSKTRGSVVRLCSETHCKSENSQRASPW